MTTLAESKDHANRQLLWRLGEKASGKQRQAVEDAAGQIEDQEDEHLYHSSGWARELWFDALGLPAKPRPPEEDEDVHSEAEAVEAKTKSTEARG